MYTQYQRNYLRIWNIGVNDWLFRKSADFNENMLPDMEKTEDKRTVQCVKPVLVW